MKVLVAAASKHGSTHEIAEAIGRGLRDRGLEVDVIDVDVVADLGDAEACVLGSAVYVGQWLGSRGTSSRRTQSYFPRSRPGCSRAALSEIR